MAMVNLNAKEEGLINLLREAVQHPEGFAHRDFQFNGKKYKATVRFPGKNDGTGDEDAVVIRVTRE